MTILLSIIYVNKMERASGFLVLRPHLKMEKSKEKNRTINNIIYTLLAHASLPPSFWHHVLHMTTYLLNILPTKQLSIPKTSFLFLP